ncbi:MAG: SPFH domain-containing protein [Candidatus Moranbacteria bacterium]|nr:SPFH domain-containing protein [Candidatus Moranbacteria bacterium]
MTIARTFTTFKENDMTTTRGFGTAVAANVTLGAILALGTKWGFGFLLGPIAGTILAYIALVASLTYFGRLGFRQIPVGFQAIQLVFGARTKKIYSEGWIWNWPSPLGDIGLVDTRQKPFEIPLTEVLTKDNVPVSINVALQIRVTDLDIYLSAEKPEDSLKNATESDIRLLAAKLSSTTIAQGKELISDAITSGKGAVGTVLEGTMLHELNDDEKIWGIKVIQVKVTHVRLPEAIEKARANVQVEAAQKVAETMETKTLAILISILTEKGIDAKDALAAIQAERGKRTIVSIEGTASDLVKAGTMAGGGILNLQSSAQASNPNPGGQRRRK